METKEFYDSSGKLSLEVSFPEPQIMKVAVVGPVDETVARQISGLVTHLFESGELRGVISDAGGGQTLSPEVISIFAKSDAFNSVRRIGVYGVTNPVFKLSLDAIIKASGRDNVRLFDSERAALEFAREEQASR